MDAPQSKHHRLHPAWTVCFACCLMMFIAMGMNANLFWFDLLRVIHVDLSFAVNVNPSLHSNACNLSCCCESIR